MSKMMLTKMPNMATEWLHTKMLNGIPYASVLVLKIYSHLHFI